MKFMIALTHLRASSQAFARPLESSNPWSPPAPPKVHPPLEGLPASGGFIRPWRIYAPQACG